MIYASTAWSGCAKYVQRAQTLWSRSARKGRRASSAQRTARLPSTSLSTRFPCALPLYSVPGGGSGPLRSLPVLLTLTEAPSRDINSTRWFSWIQLGGPTVSLSNPHDLSIAGQFADLIAQVKTAGRETRHGATAGDALLDTGQYGGSSRRLTNSSKRGSERSVSRAGSDLIDRSVYGRAWYVRSNHSNARSKSPRLA